MVSSVQPLGVVVVIQNYLLKKMMKGTPWVPSYDAASIKSHKKPNVNLLELLQDELDHALELDS